MRALVQRVSRASVSVEGEVVGSIGQGLCVLIGMTHEDTLAQVNKMADKLFKLRIFSDADDKMNLSVADIAADILIISQFTLYGDTEKGNRPSYIQAARPEVAEPLIEALVANLQDRDLAVPTGVFGANMEVEIVNDGPVTISVELVPESSP